MRDDMPSPLDFSDQPVLGQLPQQVKKPNPWASLVAVQHAPQYAGSGGGRVMPDNLAHATELLKREYPGAKTLGDQLGVALKAYGAPNGEYNLIPTDSQLQAPAITRGHDVFVPATIPSDDKQLGQGRDMGVMFHEVRHALDNVAAPSFKPEHAPDGTQQAVDSMGNQLGHFHGPMTDRDMANALDLLNLSHAQSVPDDIRTANPWMGVRGHKPTANDLFHYMGKSEMKK